MTKLITLKLSLTNAIKFCKKVGISHTVGLEEEEEEEEANEEEVGEEEGRKAQSSAAVACLQLPSMRKYAILKLLEAYSSVLPTDRIRPPTEKEQGQRMRKTTLAGQQHEMGLLNQYQAFLGILERYLRAAFTGKARNRNVYVDQSKLSNSSLKCTFYASFAALLRSIFCFDNSLHFFFASFCMRCIA